MRAEVDKAARAAYEAFAFTGGTTAAPWEKLPAVAREAWGRAGSAAIVSLGEPPGDALRAEVRDLRQQIAWLGDPSARCPSDGGERCVQRRGHAGRCTDGRGGWWAP